MDYRPRPRWSPGGTWSEGSILEAITSWAAETGEPPRSSEWRASDPADVAPGQRRWAAAYPRWPSTATVCRIFGTWAAAVARAGFEPRAIAPGSGRTTRILEAKRLRAEGWSTAAIAAAVGVSRRTARDYVRAGHCADCGQPVVTGSPRCPGCTARRTNPPRWTRAEVVGALRRWETLEGRAPTVADWTPRAGGAGRWAREHPAWPSYVSVRTLFGTWNAALRAAGLHEARPTWSRESAADAVRAFTAAHGRRPASSDMRRGNGLPSPATARRLLGAP